MELNVIKNVYRKFTHKRFVDRYICDLKYEIINSAIAFDKIDFPPKGVDHIKNCASLLRKYERRRRWLKF